MTNDSPQNPQVALGARAPCLNHAQLWQRSPGLPLGVFVGEASVGVSCLDFLHSQGSDEGTAGVSVEVC